MASNVIGSLKVLLGLDAAEFVGGFTKADQAARGFAEKQKKNAASIDRQVAAFQKQALLIGKSTREVHLYELAQKGATQAQLKSADAALRQVETHRAMSQVASAAGVAIVAAATAAATALVATIKHVIDVGDELSKLSEKSGIAVESLSALRYAGALSDVSLDDLATSTTRLAKSMSDAARGTGEGKAAFDAMGISVRNADGSLRATDEVLLDIAERFARYEDGAEQSALATAIFGKAGANLIPLLNQGREGLEAARLEAERFGLVISGETAKQAEQFNDNLTRLSFAAEGLATQALAPLIARMARLSDELLDSAKKSGLAATAWERLKAVFSGQASREFFFGTAAEQEEEKFRAAVTKASADVQTLETQLTRLQKLGDVGGAGIVAVQLGLARERLSGLSTSGDDAARELARFGRQARGAGKEKAPGLPAAGADNALRKALDAQLRTIRDFGQQQRDAYDFAQRYVDQVFDAGLISLRDNIDEQKRLRQAGVAATIESIDREVAALEKARGRATSEQRADIEQRIAEAIARRAQVAQDASRADVLAVQQEAAALDQLRQRYATLRATVAELGGDTAAASRVRIDQQVEEARRLATQAGGDPGIADALRSRLEVAEGLNQAQRDYNLLLENARLAEDAVGLAARESGTGELEVLQQLGASRRESLAQLEELVRRARELAAAAGTPEARQFADQLALSYRRAALEVDPLLTKMKELGEEAGQSIAQGFEDALIRGKSLRDVLQGIYQDLLKIATRELITNQIAASFSGGGGGGGGNGWVGAFASIVGSYFGAGGSYSYNGGVGTTNAAGISGGRANGGPVSAGGMFEVAEKRPELLDVNGRKFLLMGSQRGSIDPAPRFGSAASNVNASINVSMPPGTTRQTMLQAGATIARQLLTASRRNN